MEEYIVIALLIFITSAFAVGIYIVGNRLKSNLIKSLALFFGIFMVGATIYAPLVLSPQIVGSFESGNNIYCDTGVDGVKRIINKKDGDWIVVKDALDNQKEHLSISLHICEAKRR